MHPFYYKAASFVAMPILAASGYAGYSYTNHQNQYQYQNQNQYGQQQTAVGQLSVSGIDAPATLAVNQSGTWTVHVSGWNVYSGGQLHYSVVWGDENMHTTYAATASYPAPTVNSTGTFTHTYVVAGTYRPIFTVTDDYGHTTQAQASTQVTAGYTNQPPYGTGNGNGSTYCSTPAGYYDRSCYGATTGSYNGYGNTGSQGNTGYGNTGSTYNCSTYYDRNCYQNGQYVGPSFGSNTPTYNGPGGGITTGSNGYYGNTNTGYNSNSGYGNTNYNRGYTGSTNTGYTGSTGGGYTNTVGGPNGPDYSCYYDRACLAQMQGRTY